ncbi:hypothetical protein [Methylobacterium sp. A52T]
MTVIRAWAYQIHPPTIALISAMTAAIFGSILILDKRSTVLKSLHSIDDRPHDLMGFTLVVDVDEALEAQSCQ